MRQGARRDRLWVVAVLVVFVNIQLWRDEWRISFSIGRRQLRTTRASAPSIIADPRSVQGKGGDISTEIEESQNDWAHHPSVMIHSSTLEQDHNRVSNEPSHGATNFQNLQSHTQRPLRILSLGGSTTWGSKLQDRMDAFPYQLAGMVPSPATTTNLAVRATGASYASQCIQTMIKEAIGESTNGADDNFDVILIEYSLNGLENRLKLLLDRLRKRYPSAQIVYVHLWSVRILVENAETGEAPRNVLSQGLKFVDADRKINELLNDPTTTWRWSPKMRSDSDELRKQALEILRSVDGQLWELPMPDDPSEAFHWFGPDYHHLSSEGHRFVAKSIERMVATRTKDARVVAGGTIGDWGMGDICYSWYETGRQPSVQMQGGTLKMFVKPDKYALHVGQRFGAPAKVTFQNPTSFQLPIEVMIMTWGPGVYPKSQVQLISPDGVEQQLKETFWFDIDPLSPNESDHVFHITKTFSVGFAAPSAMSSLAFNPIGESQRPLRVIGIIMCGECTIMEPKYLEESETASQVTRKDSGEINGEFPETRYEIRPPGSQ